MSSPTNRKRQQQTLSLPGTFKSMLHPNTTGDISIQLMNFRLLDVMQTDEIHARIQLNYRTAEQKRTFNCKGIVNISQDASIKHYEMTFQSDLSTAPYFCVNFSKTLVQGAEEQRIDKGIMLSGHYTQLKNYDLGTVRIHMPASLFQEEDAPQIAPQTPVTPIMSPRGVRNCYGCGETGHLHKDCPKDQLFCYNCNQTGHSSKNCKKPKPWEVTDESLLISGSPSMRPWKETPPGLRFPPSPASSPFFQPQPFYRGMTSSPTRKFRSLSHSVVQRSFPNEFQQSDFQELESLVEKDEDYFRWQ